jgi:hypothetical protein
VEVARRLNGLLSAALGTNGHPDIPGHASVIQPKMEFPALHLRAAIFTAHIVTALDGLGIKKVHQLPADRCGC